MKKLSPWDRFLLSLAPRWAMGRIQARRAADVFARHYEGASRESRTQNWSRSNRDGNGTAGPAIEQLRINARDLVRNNPYARRGQRVIANNVVGWGLYPKAVGVPDAQAKTAAELWKAWSDSTQCDSEGRLTFPGIQHAVMRHLVTDGEFLIRKRPRRPEDGLDIPMQLQLLEADFLDLNKNEVANAVRGPIVQGIEYDRLGRRSAYWLFDSHPGSDSPSSASKPVSADNVLHILDPDRVSQARGVSWLAAVIVNLKELDEFEDAELVKQKIAACFAAFVTDTNGMSLGTEDESDDTLEALSPGSVSYLPPGKDVTMATPPPVVNSEFPTRNLRRIAAGLGIPYEDLTGDYSQSNFSSSRMARLAHWGNVWQWQFNMLIPQLCQGVWGWAMDAAVMAGSLPSIPGSQWSAPPMPMIEPDKEGLAAQRLVRAGVMTPSEMVRQQGGDPDAHWEEYAKDLAQLDSLGIQLDSDVRKVSQAGLAQVQAGASGGGFGGQDAGEVEKRSDPEEIESPEVLKRVLKEGVMTRGLSN